MYQTYSYLSMSTTFLTCTINCQCQLNMYLHNQLLSMQLVYVSTQLVTVNINSICIYTTCYCQCQLNMYLHNYSCLSMSTQYVFTQLQLLSMQLNMYVLNQSYLSMSTQHVFTQLQLTVNVNSTFSHIPTFSDLSTSKAISKRVLTCDSVHLRQHYSAAPLRN